MKKLILGVLVLALSVLGAVPVHALDVNNFTISSYNVDMTLGKDSENRSIVSAKETFTAEFPGYDQNHGPERAFVKNYDGHTVSLNIGSVTDANGNALNYHWSGDNMRIGDADAYVHGSQTYVISYTMRDVTKYYADTAQDEFYWDVIGGDWQVPISHATVNLTIDAALERSLTGEWACYSGSYGSNVKCQLQKTEFGLSTDITGLVAREGVTVSIGFQKGTFAQHQPSFMERLIMVWFIAQLILTPLAIIVMVWFVIRFSKRIERAKELGTIVPEYLPPKQASVTAAARVSGYRASVMTAQMLDLAVRHYIKIYEVKEKTIFSPAQYEVEVVKDVSGLRAEEQELLKDTFGSLPSVGGRINLKEIQNNPAYYSRTLNNDADLDKLVRGEYGFRVQDDTIKAWSRKVATAALVVGVVFVSPFWLVTALVAFVMSFMCWRLTDSGLALKRYLEGLKLYISVAETERIKMLQSPEGAEKVASVATGTDGAQLIKLYERVLPYAVLFGQEKQWNKQLGSYYEATNKSPDWYAGNNGVFNAVMFSSAMNSFSQANTYASSSSSSSGGSGGGGFSGGGGGGGGGGGW